MPALGLTGCSLLPPSLQGPTQASETAAPEDGPAAFAFEVQAEDDSLREYLTRHMQLQRFRHLPDLQDAELERLLGSAQADAGALLATLGYFSPSVRTDLQTDPATNPPQRRIRVQVQPGPRTQITSVQIELLGASGAGSADSDNPHQRPDAPALARRQRQLQSRFALPPGAPFDQSDWDSAKAEGLRQLQTQSYALARIDHSQAEIDPQQASARLQLRYDPGPLLRFGPLQWQGQQRYDSQGMRGIARLPQGAPYDEQSLLDAQQRLASSGYFDAVFLTLDTQAIDPQASSASIPVLAQVREAALQKAVFGIGLSTDTGPRLSLEHIHNRLPGIGWRAISKVELDRKQKLLSTDWTALPGASGWRWFGGLQLQRQTTGSYEVNSSRLRAGRSQTADHIDRSYYAQWDLASNQGQAAPPSSAALSAHYAWTGRYFNHPQNPTKGYGLAAELGAGLTLRPQREPFVRALLRWQLFHPLGRVDLGQGIHRTSRLSLRLEGGAVLARSSADIPVTQLFLTGGDTSVRGYGWRRIGARTQADTLYGGRYLGVASVEWQRPITLRGNRQDFESATFIDIGTVADQLNQLHPRVGIGTGLRWRSPVGPLQADLAYGVQERQLRLHLRLGYTF